MSRGVVPYALRAAPARPTRTRAGQPGTHARIAGGAAFAFDGELLGAVILLVIGVVFAAVVAIQVIGWSSIRASEIVELRESMVRTLGVR